MPVITVIGAGAFGTAISWMLKPSAHVRMWAYEEEVARSINEMGCNPHVLSDVDLSGVTASTDMACALEGAEAVIVVTPSFAVRATMEKAAAFISQELPVLVLSKGLDPSSGKLLFDTVAEVLGNRDRIAVLSGPNHAEELSKGAFAGAVVASKSQDVALYFQKLVSSGNFRLYASNDPVGVSLCAAGKNVIAIACGIARGFGLGDNAVSLLMTRGLAEIGRLVVACGGSRETCMGLAGVGDMNATCNSPHSRNGMYGETFAREGISVIEYENKRRVVVEGAHAIDPMLRLAGEKGVEMPITEAVSLLLSRRATSDEVIAALFARELKLETE